MCLGQAGNLHYEAEDLRQQCVSFLQYVKVFLHRYIYIKLTSNGNVGSLGLFWTLTSLALFFQILRTHLLPGYE